MDEPIYSLELVLSCGTSMVTYGSRGQFQPQFDAFASGAYQDRRLTVTGFSDTSDRAPVSVCVDVELVAAMRLVRQY